MKRLLLAILTLVSAAAYACYNDRDTLGFELFNKPDVQRALTGRFDRFPPLYYEMRVDRLRKKGSLTASEYDDMAVALGRLGRNAEALEALAQKAKMPNLTEDDRYRLFANRGTIGAHRWIQEGGKVANIKEIETAADDIQQALKINPNAHFGREHTQLDIIRWLISVKTAKPGDPVLNLPAWLNERTKGIENDIPLAGLIMLGGAWESPDVALAIAAIGNDDVPSLALMRYKELIKAGHKPMDQALADKPFDQMKDTREAPRRGQPSIAVRYPELRKEAEDWHDKKTAFMMAKLKKGKHPDTDKDFWSGWKEPLLPVLPTLIPGAEQQQLTDSILFPATFFVVPILFLYALYKIGRLVKRWRTARAR